MAHALVKSPSTVARPIARPAARTKRLAEAAIWSNMAKRGHTAYADLFEMPSIDRASLVKRGTPSIVVGVISKEMDISRDRFVRITGLARATVTRKMGQNANLSVDESERIVGLAKLIGQVETMVRESGEPSGFHPARWFGEWISQPVPALGGRRPDELLDTADGRETVSRLLAQMQSGVYA